MTPILRNPREIVALNDWGPVLDMIEGQTSGVRLHEGEGGESETGIWLWTPGEAGGCTG